MAFAVVLKMADPDQSADKNTDKSTDKKDIDPRLDFYSDKFDPLFALSSSGVVIPVPKAKVYDNLSTYYSSKQQRTQQNKTEAAKQKQVAPGTSGTSRFDVSSGRRFLPHQMPVPSVKKPFEGRNIYTRLENMSGPFALLKKCLDEKIQVKVYTRNHKEIRGYCIGHVVIFDKHWNLLLENATEVWTRPKTRKVPALDTYKSNRSRKFSVAVPEIKIVSSTKSSETCSRFVEQFLMRGEHVVSISVLK